MIMENAVTDIGNYSILKLLFSLTFVIGMIFLTTYLYKRFSLNKLGKLNTKGQFLSVLTTLPIGSKKYLSVIKAGEKFLLIGITENSINLISELNDVEIVEEEKRNNFMDILKKAKKGLDKKDA